MLVTSVTMKSFFNGPLKAFKRAAFENENYSELFHIVLNKLNNNVKNMNGHTVITVLFSDHRLVAGSKVVF